ncbi:MAG: hypothetical protein WBQ08_17815 [Candidatus Sulfotelmatobacter sp.]
MAKLRVRVPALLIFVSCLAVFCLAQDQTDSCAFFPNQQVRVTNLGSLTAPSKDTTAVIAAAVEAVLHDPTLCCGKDSALGDLVLSEPRTLKELSTKLQGRHLLSDGRPILVNAEYTPQISINSGSVIGALKEQRASLFEWKSHVYVLYGAIFGENRCLSGAVQYSIAKFLLLDPRFSDQRRDAVYNRETDDLGKVQGLLTLSVVPQ